MSSSKRNKKSPIKSEMQSRKNSWRYKNLMFEKYMNGSQLNDKKFFETIRKLIENYNSLYMNHIKYRSCIIQIYKKRCKN